MKPKLKHEYETIEGQIKLYYNQVFVADNVKEIVPEFLMLLKGVLDCPDLPLNVSRSFLQNDGYVKKLSSHITKKVGDKLVKLFEEERDSYNSYWDDINPFVKYGCIREDKFYDRVKDILIYKNISGEYITLEDYRKKSGGDTVYYVSDEQQQAGYIAMFKKQGMDAVVLPHMIDTHFIQMVESKEEGKVKFKRIDADMSESLVDSEAKSDAEADEKLGEMFKKAIGREKLGVKVESFKNADVSAVIIISEESRRMQEMARMYGGGMSPDMFPAEESLHINRTNPLVQAVTKTEDEGRRELICKHIYDMALLSHRQLTSEEMQALIERSNRIMELLAQ